MLTLYTCFCFKSIGTLDLFGCDGMFYLAIDDTCENTTICAEHGQPKNVVKSLVPKWNNFVFFDVNAVSFHQV